MKHWPSRASLSTEIHTMQCPATFELAASQQILALLRFSSAIMVGLKKKMRIGYRAVAGILFAVRVDFRAAMFLISKQIMMANK